MAIVQIRNMMEKKGCQVLIWSVMGLVAISMVGISFLQGWFMPDPNKTNSPVVIQVAGQNITTEEYQKRLEDTRAQAAQNPMLQMQLEMGGPTAQLQLIGQTVSMMVQQGAVQTLATQNSVKVTDDLAKKSWEGQINSEIDSRRAQLLQGGQLKPPVDEAKFDAAYKAAYGELPADTRKRAMDEFEKELKGDKRKELLSSFVGPVLLDHFASKSKKTEADVKTSFDTYFINRLGISDASKSQADLTKMAEAARAELASGKPFAEVYKKYVPNSTETPAPMEQTRAMLEQTAPLKPILDLQKGGITQPISEGGAVAIYQLIKVENKLPAEYEKNKERLLIDLRKADAQAEMQKKVDELVDSTVTWKSPALKVAYQTFKALSDPISSTKDKFRELIKQADDAMSDVLVGTEPAILAKYAAMNSLYTQSTPTEQKELLPDWIDITTQVLASMESPTLRMALADLYFEQGTEDALLLAGGALQEAVTNTPVVDPMGEFIVKDAESRIQDKAKGGKLAAEQKQAVIDAIAAWRKEKAAFDKETAENEAAQKKAEEELKKQMEEETKRQEAQEKKAATSGTGATPPTGTAPKADEPKKPEGQ